jgi:nicotinate-nucleotide adenylyltransferase
VNLGILGGTFDPIHWAHLLIAEEARVRLNLARVLFIPAGQPWLRAEQVLSPAEHRLAMVRMAVADNPHFSVSSLEIERPGPSYTVETLEVLRREYGSEADLYFILGQDSLWDFHRWREPGHILSECTLVGVARPGTPEFEPRTLEQLWPGGSQRLVTLQGLAIGISGTEIRRRVAEGLSIRYWVPRPVEEYIHRHGLYRGGTPSRRVGMGDPGGRE